MVAIEEAVSEPKVIRSAPASRVELHICLLVVCAVPLLFSIPSLGDPFGQTEEAVNAAIWALGGRNILEKGPVAARLGASVAPYPGTKDGIYAHHPPLPAWLAAAAQLPGRWEGWPRLLALVLAGVSLLLLFHTLSRFAPEETALLATAVIATSPFLLSYGRLLTTLTIATPLFLVLLDGALGRLTGGERWGGVFLAAIPLAFFSSWDGVLGAGAVVIFLTLLEVRDAYHHGSGRSEWCRALAPALVGVVSLAALLAYFGWANNDLGEMLTHARMRTGASDAVPPLEWITRQLGFVASGLGWLTFLVLMGATILLALRGGPRGLLAAILLGAVPGVAMTIIFRNGAYSHPFWSYNLIIPAALAVAYASTLVAGWHRRGASLLVGVLMVVQAVVGFRVAGDQLGRERLLNSVGALARDYFRQHPVETVKVMSAYDFHPYVSWYLRVPTEVVYSVRDLHERLLSARWAASEPLLVDTDFARDLGCKPFQPAAMSDDRRWAIAPGGAVDAACSVSLMRGG
ncbi:MAG: hypothetical protein E6J77_26390 [Deltaproteobacteria bacterium]|nr:MAG: hypothetical protein E6J77_26390 [Deltaproteobacteria bacterium]